MSAAPSDVTSARGANTSTPKHDRTVAGLCLRITEVQPDTQHRKVSVPRDHFKSQFLLSTLGRRQPTGTPSHIKLKFGRRHETCRPLHQPAITILPILLTVGADATVTPLSYEIAPPLLVAVFWYHTMLLQPTDGHAAYSGRPSPVMSPKARASENDPSAHDGSNTGVACSTPFKCNQPNALGVSVSPAPNPSSLGS